MRRLVLMAGIATCSMIPSLATPAWAGAFSQEASVGATASTGGITAAVSVSSQPPEEPSAAAVTHKSGGSAPVCSLTLASASVQSLLGQPPGEPPGQWFWLTCNSPGFTNPEPPTFIPNGRAAAPAPTPAAVAQQALATAPLPSPRIGTDPDSDHLLVNYPTRLYLTSGWAPISASASVGGVSATVTAAPTRVTWSMGDGSTVVCNGPGSPYHRNESWASQNPPPCGHTYRHSSADQPNESYQLTATVTYQASWTAQGAAGGGSLGTVTRSSTIPVIVGEVQALEG